MWSNGRGGGGGSGEVVGVAMFVGGRGVVMIPGLRRGAYGVRYSTGPRNPRRVHFKMKSLHRNEENATSRLEVMSKDTPGKLGTSRKSEIGLLFLQYCKSELLLS